MGGRDRDVGRIRLRRDFFGFVRNLYFCFEGMRELWKEFYSFRMSSFVL